MLITIVYSQQSYINLLCSSTFPQKQKSKRASYTCKDEELKGQFQKTIINIIPNCLSLKNPIMHVLYLILQWLWFIIFILIHYSLFLLHLYHSRHIFCQLYLYKNYIMSILCFLCLSFMNFTFVYFAGINVAALHGLLIKLHFLFSFYMSLGI